MIAVRIFSLMSPSAVMQAMLVFWRESLVNVIGRSCEGNVPMCVIIVGIDLTMSVYLLCVSFFIFSVILLLGDVMHNY